MDKIQINNIIKEIYTYFKNVEIYPKNHPLVKNPIYNSFNMLNDFIKLKNQIMIGIIKDVVFFEDYLFEERNPFIEYIGDRFKKNNIESVVLYKGLTIREFVDFLDIIKKDSNNEEDVKEAFNSRNIKHIKLKFFSLDSEKIEKEARRIYFKSIKIIAGVFKDIRMGKVPNMDNVSEVVGDMINIISKDRSIIIGLTMIKDYDNYLYNHSVNVGILSLSLAEYMNIRGEELNDIGVGSLLHDIGKIKTSESIIKKPGPLTEEEWDVVKKHPILGAKMLEIIDKSKRDSMDIVLEHHIRYDRKGYPRFDKGRELKAGSMIVSIADCYDAMTTLRPYQRAFNPREAIEIMVSYSGKNFHPGYLKNFINLVGIYPPGTLVRLNNNNLGIVWQQNSKYPTHPVIKIIVDGNGNRLQIPQKIDLSKFKDIYIVSAIDPLIKGIDIKSYMF
jgi:putative nucleotidyltransferase with HDIG domain